MYCTVAATNNNGIKEQGHQVATNMTGKGYFGTGGAALRVLRVANGMCIVIDIFDIGGKNVLTAPRPGRLKKRVSKSDDFGYPTQLIPASNIAHFIIK
jgi:hypothetical protein